MTHTSVPFGAGHADQCGFPCPSRGLVFVPICSYLVSGPQCHPPEDAEATPGAGPQAAEAKSTVAGQVSEGEGEMLDRRAGRLPAGERLWWRLGISRVISLPPTPPPTPPSHRWPMIAWFLCLLDVRAQYFVRSLESGTLSPGGQSHSSIPKMCAL